MMAWHWDQGVRTSHGAHGACLVFVGCPSKTGHIMFVKIHVHSQRVEKVEKEAEWVCGVCVRAGSEGRGVGPKARAQSATHKDRPFLLIV